MKHNLLSLLSAVGCVAVIACSPAGGENRGHEFMPDMVHSTAYEANIYEYYYYNTWGTEKEYEKYAQPRKSVPGTIARGSVHAALSKTPEGRLEAYQMFTGETSPTAIEETVNGSVPYPYANTDSGRVKAAEEILTNPFPITKAGLEEGKNLYTIYCAICHGAKGDGLGYLVREADPSKGITAGVYPAQPANFLKETFIDSTEGMYYHTIMYGKNVMGSYADKLSYKERWEVIHHIRELQAKSRGAAYNENENTLNANVPGGPILKAMQEKEDSMHAVEGSNPPGDETEHGEMESEH